MLIHIYQAVIGTFATTALMVFIMAGCDHLSTELKVGWVVLTLLVSGAVFSQFTYEYHTNSLESRFKRETSARLDKLIGSRFAEVESSGADHKTVQRVEDDHRVVIVVADELYAPTTVAPIAEMFRDYSSDYEIYRGLYADAKRLLDENRGADPFYVDQWNSALKTSHDAIERIRPMLRVIRDHPKFKSQQRMFELGRQTKATEDIAESARATAQSANTVAWMSIIKK